MSEVVSEDPARGSDAFLASIVDCVAQPPWVVTAEGTISYVNLAAVTALDFDEAAELVGQNGHWLVHYKRRDGSPFPIEDCPLARIRQTGGPLYLSEDWWVRKDGSMTPVACTAIADPGARRLRRRRGLHRDDRAPGR